VLITIWAVKALTGELFIPETTHPHIWNHWVDLTTVELTEGLHVLTLKTVRTGLMNYAYIEFVRK